MAGTRLYDRYKFVNGLSNTTPSTSTPARVNMKNYNHLTIIINALNATTVTGSAITVKQSKSSSGGSEKALSFATVLSNIDTATSDAQTETAVVSDTFTTDTTNSKILLYVIEIDATKMDVNNGFNWLRLGTGDAAATTLTVQYILSGARDAGPQAIFPTAVV